MRNTAFEREARAGFEQAMIRDTIAGFNPACGKANSLIKDGDRYRSREVEAAWLGYLACAMAHHRKEQMA